MINHWTIEHMVFIYMLVQTMLKTLTILVYFDRPFQNEIAGEPCSQEEYDKAQAVWSHVNLKIFGDYHDLYLNTNVFLVS